MRLGPLGNLQDVEGPDFGMQPTTSQAGSVHRLLGGGHVVDNVGGKRRVYSMSWTSLGQSEYDALRGLYLGHYGPGPYVLIDPTETNLLSGNQSSGTDVLRDTTGFAEVGSGALSSSTTNARTGVRSLAWAPTLVGDIVVTGSSTTATVGDPDDDVPVLPSTSYTASVYAMRGADACSVKARIYWCTEDGSAISSDDGSAAALTTSFARFTVSATSPATAALARVALVTTAVTSTPTVYADDWQFEQASAASTFTPGQGVPRVSFKPDSWQPTAVFDNVWDLSATLVEA